MSSSIERRGGGLIRTPGAKCLMAPRLRSSGADVSWLSRARVGDDQGNIGACGLFAMASWAEIMFGKDIPDDFRIMAYRDACRDLHRGDEGLSFEEAYTFAKLSGWLPGTQRVVQVYDLDNLPRQPILAGYMITPAWDFPNEVGCLDHAAPRTDRGYHAVCIVAHGRIEPMPDTPLVYIENSWGVHWGWRGIGVMTEALHNELCGELWVIE